MLSFFCEKGSKDDVTIYRWVKNLNQKIQNSKQDRASRPHRILNQIPQIQTTIEPLQSMFNEEQADHFHLRSDRSRGTISKTHTHSHKHTPRASPKSAICVQRLDDSLTTAIRTTFRISLRSSSLRDSRDPLVAVCIYFFISCSV